MTERIDHTGWAREFIRAAENAFDDEVTIDAREAPTVAENIALAQVHATLALVEQQRLANLITLAAIPGAGTLETAAAHALLIPSDDADWDSRPTIRPEIREGLGL